MAFKVKFKVDWDSFIRAPSGVDQVRFVIAILSIHPSRPATRDSFIYQNIGESAVPTDDARVRKSYARKMINKQIFCVKC